MAETSFGSLHNLFVHELKDILDAEHQITEALPKMSQAATSPTLKQKFDTHLQQTREQITRLEQIFQMLQMPPERERCVGMAGLIQEGEMIVSAQGEPSVRDAGLIAAAQKVEHYEISAYGTLRTFARTLGLQDVANLLQTTLKEESYTDETLTQLAERSVNKRAA